MTRVRSPPALMASLACLSCAAVMAGVLAGQEVPTPLASADEGDPVDVHGELAAWSAPGTGWEMVNAHLWDTTYQLAIHGIEDVVLLTGMQPGLEHQAVVARAVVLLQEPHPDLPIDIIVLAPQEETGVMR